MSGNLGPNKAEVAVEQEIGHITLSKKPVTDPPVARNEAPGLTVNTTPAPSRAPPPTPPPHRAPPAPPKARTAGCRASKFFRTKPQPPPPAGLTRDYAPAIPSPLRTDGGNEAPGDEVQRGPSLKRRNLQVRVVNTAETEGNLVKLDSETSDNPETTSDESAAEVLPGPSRSTRPPRPPREVYPSPAVSVQSLGRDFTRYPSPKTSGHLRSGRATPEPTTASPLGVPHSAQSALSEPYAFESNDPERGFSPYLIRRGGPVVYPSLDEKEEDDYLHDPSDDKNPPVRLRDCCATCNMRMFFTCIAVTLFLLGLFTLFIVWPVLAYTGRTTPHSPPAAPVERLSNITYPILSAVRTSLIDPDTPDYALKRKSVLGKKDLKLVFSDEFTTPGRTFYEGEDQFWQAADIHYAATGDMEWYDPDAITTANGTLQIRMEQFFNHDLQYRSGMLQSWNKMCFKGGVMEVSASLAGPKGVPGLWPGIWTLGNLARPGYRATSDGVWPYAYNECDVGITPNQSSTDGLSFLPGQRLNSCVCKGQDHPTPGTGRGAPEIDALEGTVDYQKLVGVVTQSNQVAPFDVFYMADTDFMAVRDPGLTTMNSWRGGPFQQAISGVTVLNNDWYEGNQYQKYAFEYKPGGKDGQVAWFVGDDETFRMTGNAIGPNGNIGQREISKEPMSVILNLGFSESWTWIDWEKIRPALARGTTMYIDYVRIYQEEGKEMITCDPPGYETTKYIRDHLEPYMNANLTTWAATKYDWPKNRLMHGCK